ncbi:MAG: hypothetical protein OXG96_16005 [Acidobacteria bacterium]|nr:hypothetical protein [Acidobacteriota bacterium]
MLVLPRRPSLANRTSNNSWNARKWVGALSGWVLCFALAPDRGARAAEAPPAEPGAPELRSLFPVSVQRGRVLDLEVRGKDLEKCYGVWFGTGGLSGQVARIEGMQFQEKKNLRAQKLWVQGQRVSLRIQVASEVPLGKHELRLVTPAGVSNALGMVVVDEAVSLEDPGPHGRPAQAQSVEIPTLLNGRLSRHGEVDFYSFEASSGDRLVIQALSNTTVTKFDGVRLTLYKERGSWFDPERPQRLLFSPRSRITHLCRDSGRYLVEVSSNLGVGGPDFFYQLRVATSAQAGPGAPEVALIPPSALAEIEQPFRRKLDPSRLDWLESRTVPAEKARENGSPQAVAGAGSTGPSSGSGVSPERAASAKGAGSGLLSEAEPNDLPEQAAPILPPQLLEGAIQSPGDVDWFRFEVEAGTSLALELETPVAAPPRFNPRVAVLDADGREVLTNYFRKIAGDGDDWVRLIQAKTLYAFDRAGLYKLQVRDITPRSGEPAFRYRLLLRPQVPHVGRIEATPEVVNLRPGQAQKVTILSDQEEGFGGDILFSAGGLPSRVQFLPGAEVEPHKEPPLPEIHKERFVPRNQTTTVLLAAAPGAPSTRMPARVRLSARPVVGGKVGEAIAAGELLVMVLGE